MITLTINGRHWTGELADPTMPLQWMLRDIVGVGGQAQCCGSGRCSGCLVLADGALARACAAGVENFAGREVVTIEGLRDLAVAGRSGVTGEMLQEMWATTGLPACEECRPPVLLALYALLRRGAMPNSAEVDDVVSNICGCVSRIELRDAVIGLCARVREESN